jgi:hypothetical protein
MSYSTLRKAKLAFGYAGLLLLSASPGIGSATIFKLTTNGNDSSPATGFCDVSDSNRNSGVYLLSCTNTMDVLATDLHIFGDFVDPVTGLANPAFAKKIPPFDPIHVLPGKTFEVPINNSILYDKDEVKKARDLRLALNVYGFWSTCASPRSESGTSSTASTSPGTCSIPEPETSMLMVGGLTGLAFIRTRRQKGGGKLGSP